MNKVVIRHTRFRGPTRTITVSNLRTDDGVDWQADHMGSSRITSIKNIALSTMSDTPSSASTNLPNELAANGLSRKTGTYAHTAGASTYTLSASWQYTGGSVVTVASAAIAHDPTDTDASTDTHQLIALVSPVVVMNSNDTIDLAWGITI